MDETLRKPSARLPMKTAPHTEPVEPTLAARSFERAFLEHWDTVYRLLVRMLGDPAEAEDLALETFFRLHRHPPREGAGHNLAGWLYRVATNLGLRSIRSFRRREQYELSAGKAALASAPEDRPSVLFEKKEQDRLARQALAKMNPRRAELLVLRYSGMPYKDIARALGLSPTSIGPLLLRAEREFAKVYRALDQEEQV
ncbi:MAG TPA: sigma-70 family RNA polymerase sigma factor [Anaerolineales bacterium]|nr:sigma-70 family RNA polymerase sigma factor [Anaerolineales bacterium]